MLNATDFRNKVDEVTVPTGNGPFQTAYAEQLAEIIGDIEAVINNADESGDFAVDDERVTELVTFWIDRFAEQAYRTLADSLNKSYSHAVGRLYEQAQAKAYFDAADELKSFRDYGVFFDRVWLSDRP